MPRKDWGGSGHMDCSTEGEIVASCIFRRLRPLFKVSHYVSIVLPVLNQAAGRQRCSTDRPPQPKTRLKPANAVNAFRDGDVRMLRIHKVCWALKKSWHWRCALKLQLYIRIGHQSCPERGPALPVCFQARHTSLPGLFSTLRFVFSNR